MRTCLVIVMALTLVMASTVYAEHEWYVAGSVSYLMQSDSDNSGTTGDFTTGNGAPVIPFGTPIAAGTPYGWETEFDSGWALSGEGGLMYDSGLRSGIELTYSSADVDTHKNVNVAGTVIDGVDAAVLTGSSSQLGATVGQVVSDGQGKISSTGIFMNLYYDFIELGSFYPYVGAGIGVMAVDVEYEPSGVKIIDDDETKVGFQLKAGATYRCTDTIDIYGEYAFRMTDDVEVDNSLFPGKLDIENKQHLVSIGLRYRFATN
ncbi:outer membrane beta-barrel protein [Desulfogranum marinum]|uniref:outer membrane beta-barrel protein n=1 Tax=Desulfogranum marinum TaxID=453220 RepID=UPI0019645EA7|nr:outer membrane beta-barrel protein [Desulfogranum marinum]MBM9512152.1 porin family protein [Desulfogranum marinum]